MSEITRFDEERFPCNHAVNYDECICMEHAPNCEVVCLLSKCKEDTKNKIEYREEEIADCACIYG